MGKIAYTRNTTYTITHEYTAPTYLGTNLRFTVKSVQNDTDPTDVTNSILTPKNISMSGSSFPQSTTITIAPTDIAVTQLPGTYYYSIKIFDSNSGEYVVDSGTFVMTASSTNETTP